LLNGCFGVNDRADWLLENILVAVTIPLLIVTYRRFRLSNLSYTLIFVFTVLHAVGAHSTGTRRRTWRSPAVAHSLLCLGTRSASGCGTRAGVR
jgi:uncharacterized membrane protein YjdF